MDPSVEEPEGSLFNFKARSEETAGQASPTLTSLRRLDLNETRSPLRKPVFHHSSSSDSEWETDSSAEEDEAAGVLKRLLQPNPQDLGDFKNGEPENGSQYLFQVMKEAKKEPKFVKAPLTEEDIQKRVREAQVKGKLSSNPYFTLPENSQEVKTESSQKPLLPTRQWETEVISKFSSLHSKVNRWRTLIEQNTIRVPLPQNVDLPNINANMKWLHFFFGSKIYDQIQSGVRRRVLTVDRINSFFMEDFPEDLGLEKLIAEAKTRAEQLVAEAVSKAEQVLEQNQTDLQDQSQSQDSDKHSHSGYDEEDGSASDNEEEHVDAVEGNVNETGDIKINADAQVINESTASATGSTEVPIPRHHPQMSIMLNIGQRSLEQLVTMNLNWLKHYGWVHELQGKWFYALLICLQKPLEADVMADLREIAKICRKTRAAIWKSQEEYSGCGDGDSTMSETNRANITAFLNTMNLFICLVGNYFQQRDLADTLTD